MDREVELEEEYEEENDVVTQVTQDEVKAALRRMKKGKAVGPDDIPAEAWKCLGEIGAKVLTNLMNAILETERMPEDWRESTLVTIYKGKGDIQDFGNYRGIKLMSHTMKIWERIMDARLRQNVKISEEQFGFMPVPSTTDAIFALRQLVKNHREGQKVLHCVIIDLEKAYHRVPRKEVWNCMRMKGVPKNYIRIVQDMYQGSRTRIRTAVGTTERFEVTVGVHQDSVLSPFLFAVVMNCLMEELRKEAPWTMMFADDVVICSESKTEVEERLKRWDGGVSSGGQRQSTCVRTTKTEDFG